jgi:cytochrome c biogenesis protein CcmG/thiol:disulfide interchange protein DsbE
MRDRAVRLRVMVFLLVVGVGITSLLVLTRPLSTAAPMSSSRPGFVAIGEATDGLGVGQRPPPLAGPDGVGTLVDLGGIPVDLESLRGRPVWVVYWATWCPPCQSETPDLQRAFEGNAPSGLELVAVDVQEPEDSVREYIETYGLTYRVALDTTGIVMKAWGVFGLPTHYFIDRDGIVRDRVYGPLTLEAMQARLDLITPP